MTIQFTASKLIVNGVPRYAKPNEIADAIKKRLGLD